MIVLLHLIGNVLLPVGVPTGAAKQWDSGQQKQRDERVDVSSHGYIISTEVRLGMVASWLLRKHNINPSHLVTQDCHRKLAGFVVRFLRQICASFDKPVLVDLVRNIQFGGKALQHVQLTVL